MEVLQHPQHDTNRNAIGRPVGIMGHGAYIPRYRLPAREIARVWSDPDTVPVGQEKSVPGQDEDTATMCMEASANALSRAGVPPSAIEAVWIGSESHPYAVKPTGTIVAEAIGATPLTLAADLEFACKAGTEALQAGMGFVGSGRGTYALVAGMDTAQSRPGDALEYTAAAGGAVLILGPAAEAPVTINHALSWVTDTPDFWRRQNQPYPMHAGRFTGEPGFFQHVLAAGRKLMEDMGSRPSDYRHVVVHQPNLKFATRVLTDMGFRPDQWQRGLLVGKIGNTYAGSTLLGLSAILDRADAGDRVLAVSYGSGGGSDAIDMTVTRDPAAWRSKAPETADYLARRVVIDYATYARMRDKIQT